MALVVNASLCVLIWIVQLVVYPGFCYYSEVDLKRWHSIYTVRITYIVLPLMLSQLGWYTYAVFTDASLSRMVLFALVVASWLVTFLVSVPLHAAIDKQSNTVEVRKKLVQTNWIRTLIWTLIFLLSMIFYGK